MPVWLKDLSLVQHLPFKISNQEFTYLEIQVTKDFSPLYKANYTPLLNKLQTSIQFWRLCPILLIDRINRINTNKMVFLPQLYLFQCLPVFLPKSSFRCLDSIILPSLPLHLGLQKP